MRKILLMLIAFTIFVLAFPSSASAADVANGAKVFNSNCAACHMGGKNVVMATKTLQKDALEKYSMDSLEAIINQVTNGKNAMPAFKGKLNPQQIEDVASYVLEKADKGWS
jgi:cytochrome c6